MDFELSDTAKRLREKLAAFMDSHVYPAEKPYEDFLRESGDPHAQPPIMEELKRVAQEQGLWNLFLPHATEWTEGLSNLDYAPL
ncbi:MAG: Medium-chain acyl-CoA dehydrogenase, partial [Frankiales bacterium]|nr:Medium-chain acyl-CoA dehydrogenase [Frankiales bacterium]